MPDPISTDIMYKYCISIPTCTAVRWIICTCMIHACTRVTQTSAFPVNSPAVFAPVVIVVVAY